MSRAHLLADYFLFHKIRQYIEVGRTDTALMREFDRRAEHIDIKASDPPLEDLKNVMEVTDFVTGRWPTPTE